MKRSPLKPLGTPHRPGPMAHALSLMALTVALLTAAGTRADSPQTPRTIGGIAVVEVAGGNDHSCARVETGLVYCWGFNGMGQLGDGTTTDRLAPVQVTGLTDVVQIAVGHVHSCARLGNGRVLCWGANTNGQLGNGTNTNSSQPIRVRGLSAITDIAVGMGHGCARRANGRVFCWGNNSHGQIGDGTTTDALVAVRVNGPAVTSAVAVSAGRSHSCLLRGGGRVTCWGDNAVGQLGQGHTVTVSGPVVVSVLSSVTAIATGYDHNCALRGNGRLFCWGSNANGLLGIGLVGGIRATPQRVDSLTNVVSMGLGPMHGCAIRGVGQLFCWGQGARGQLGDGASVSHSVPTAVAGPLIAADAVNVAAGTQHSCAVRKDGHAFCWGFNAFGQLGDGTTDTSPVPGPLRS